jgi:anthranilate synthase component 1
MVKPDINEYRALAFQYKRVPVYREIAGDMVTPIGLLESFSNEVDLFLLESANLDKSFSRYTFFGFSPSEKITFRGGALRSESRERGVEIIKENPIDYLKERLAGESSHSESEMGNFCGGFVGFIGYDMANHMGILRKKIKEEGDDLLMGFFRVDEFYVFDNLMKKFYAAVSTRPGDDPDAAYSRAAERTLAMGIEILGCNRKFSVSEVSGVRDQDFTREEFMQAVSSLQKEITAGEAIQTVLSNKYEIAGSFNPVNLYRILRNINPSPYMFYMKFGSEVVCGTSPEVHLKIAGRKALLKPIAGTARYDKDHLEEVKAALLGDEKERAEHLMLLDLARNDLNAGCVPGSVKVEYSFAAEVYSHVIHIVSEVTGRLAPDTDPVDLFCATFPAGTVSGAPKVRAMELIDECERSARGFYAGCAGYFSYSRDIDTCILIRSAMVKPASVIFRAGAGIVFDSVPEKEFAEVENKLGAMFHSLEKISLLERKNVFND